MGAYKKDSEQDTLSPLFFNYMTENLISKRDKIILQKERDTFLLKGICIYSFDNSIPEAPLLSMSLLAAFLRIDYSLGLVDVVSLSSRHYPTSLLQRYNYLHHLEVSSRKTVRKLIPEKLQPFLEFREKIGLDRLLFTFQDDVSVTKYSVSGDGQEGGASPVIFNAISVIFIIKKSSRNSLTNVYDANLTYFLLSDQNFQSSVGQILEIGWKEVLTPGF